MRTSIKERLLSTTIVAGLATVGALGLMPTVAVAQQSNQEEQEGQAARNTQVEEVVVVGSRIRRDNYNSPSPVQVVTREESTLAGFASTAEVLQSTSVTGGAAQINNAFGGFVTDGGPGANTLSLRGLGATRTLILLNGRRVAPAGSRGSVGSADLNVLPSAMIERIEILRDGASSIYGSDAVAGVVNIITRNNVEDITVEAQYNGSTDANGGGDSSRISIVGGTGGDRWHISGSAEYYSREELRIGDRDFTQCNIDGFNGQGGRSDFIDPLTGRSKCYPITTTGSNGVTINTIGTGQTQTLIFGNPAYARAAGSPDDFYYASRWRPNSAVTTGLPGFEAVGGFEIDDTGAFLVATNNNIRDTFDPRMLNNSMISPVEVSTAYLQGSYDLGALGNAELYAEVLLNRRESSQTGYRQLSVDYRKGSPLIPAGLQFSTFSPNQGISGANAGMPAANVGVRAFVGFGNDQSSQSLDFVKTLAGIRGDFFIADWRYDAYVSHTTSNAEYTFQQFLIDRMTNSLNVVVAPAGTPSYLTRTGVLGTTNTQGTVTCAINVVTPGSNCIPAPFLTSQTIGGVLPQDWVDYVFRPVTGTTDYTETVASIGIDGPLFTLPAGQVSAFFGAEWRKSEIDDTPGADMQTANLWNFSTASPTRGDDSVWEVFGEVEVPLLANAPLAQELTFNASVRYTNYDSAGDNTTYKVGFVYTPVDFATFRATYGTSYRAPALFEQFLGATSGFIDPSFDPCDELTAADNPNVLANCATQGLGLGSNFNANQSVRVFTLGGAANNLEAETSDNLTVGVILQPSLPSEWGDLSFAADYYQIEINNSVTRLSGGAILADCFQSSTADFNARAGNCSFMTRNATTTALTVESSYINIATDVVKGLDYTLRYRRDIGPGSALLNVGITQLTEATNQTLPTDPVRDQVGRLNVPEFSGSADIQYSWDAWRVRYGVEWIQATGDNEYYRREFNRNIVAEGYDFEVEDYWLHNASVQYRTDKWTATAGIRNLFNEEPPTISAGSYNRIGNAPLYSGYDYLGRSFFVNVSKSF